jgi:hypothetical protein
VIRSLGPAEAGTVQGPSSLPVMFLAFLVLAMLGCGAILVLARVRGREEPGEPAIVDLDGAAGPEFLSLLQPEEADRDKLDDDAFVVIERAEP